MSQNHIKAGRARQANLTLEQRQALARSGGLARSLSMSEQERSEAARHAARLRWANHVTHLKSLLRMTEDYLK